MQTAIFSHILLLLWSKSKSLSVNFRLYCCSGHMTFEPWLQKDFADFSESLPTHTFDEVVVKYCVCVHACVRMHACVPALLLPMLVSKLNCLYLLQEEKGKREDGADRGVGVKINLLDQKIFNFAAHQTNFVFRQGVLRRACLFFSLSSSLHFYFFISLLLFSLIKKAFYYYSRWKGNIYSNSTVVPDYH